MVLKIGITGGIASGKSKCLNYLAKNYQMIYTMNLDEFAFKMYARNPIVLRNLQVCFGKNVVANGEINRKLLAKKIFSNPNSLKALTDITSP